MTTIYLINNANINKNYINDKNNDNLEYRIKNQELSYEGRLLAEKISHIEEIKNIDYIYTGNYKSAIETANIISNNKNLIIDDKFNMRTMGVTKISEIPAYYNEQHFLDNNYKLPNGESQEEIRDRMYKGLIDILNKYNNNKIIIVSSKTCITYLLRIWCDIKYHNNYKYKDKIIYNISSKHNPIFKLIFNKKELINIEEIKY